MTEKETAAFKVIDEVCAEFQCNRKAHVVIQESLRVILEALNPMKEVVVPDFPPKTGKKKEVEDDDGAK